MENGILDLKEKGIFENTAVRISSVVESYTGVFSNILISLRSEIQFFLITINVDSWSFLDSKQWFRIDLD